eukprot:scaffold129060_cov33-Prasinocladus_malaysianus.AAC.2
MHFKGRSDKGLDYLLGIGASVGHWCSQGTSPRFSCQPPGGPCKSHDELRTDSKGSNAILLVASSDRGSRLFMGVVHWVFSVSSVASLARVGSLGAFNVSPFLYCACNLQEAHSQAIFSWWGKPRKPLFMGHCTGQKGLHAERLCLPREPAALERCLASALGTLNVSNIGRFGVFFGLDGIDWMLHGPATALKRRLWRLVVVKQGFLKIVRHYGLLFGKGQARLFNSIQQLLQNLQKLSLVEWPCLQNIFTC